MGAHFHLTPAHRARIEDHVEALIALLDADDGDPDLEDDDPAEDVLDLGEYDEARLLPRPKYGLDQSLGPVNGWDARRQEEIRHPPA